MIYVKMSIKYRINIYNQIGTVFKAFITSFEF